jgi:hypothetical protein
MNTTAQQNSALNHEAIARLACQLWQQEGGQSGRDQEYWLRAEQQLRAISQQADVPTNNGLMKLNLAEGVARNTTSQPAKPAGANQASPPKRVPVKSKAK